MKTTLKNFNDYLSTYNMYVEKLISEGLYGYEREAFIEVSITLGMNDFVFDYEIKNNETKNENIR